MGEWGGTIFLALVAFAALIVLYMIIRRAMPKDVMDEIAAMRRRLEGEALAPEPEVAVGEQEVARMRMTIKDLISKNPRGVANVVRRWLAGK